MSLASPDIFVTLSVASRGVAVETRINGVHETFVSGGEEGDLAASAPINPYLDRGTNTVEFALSPVSRASGEPNPPEFRASLELHRRGDIVDTGSAGERPIFVRELSAAESASLAAGRAVTITETFSLDPARLHAAAQASGAVPVAHRSEFEAEIQTTLGQRGTRRQVEIVTLGPDAAEAAAPGRDAWSRIAFHLRPDWADGRIRSRDDRSGGRAQAAAVAWAILTIGLVASTWQSDGLMKFIGLGVAVVAAALIVQAIRIRLHSRKFGENFLVLERTPVLLGRDVSGEVESGVPAESPPADGFRVRLRCVHRWQETIDRRGDRTTRQTRYRRDTLWEDEHRTAGRRDPARGTLNIPVRFRLPTNQPSSSIPDAEEGIVWEVVVTAQMRGLDYSARFEIPVVAP